MYNNALFNVFIYFVFAERKKLDANALRSGLTERDNDIRYSIFKDLWERGYYITSGSKFGSDYLLYPGKSSEQNFILYSHK